MNRALIAIGALLILGARTGIAGAIDTTIGAPESTGTPTVAAPARIAEGADPHAVDADEPSANGYRERVVPEDGAPTAGIATTDPESEAIGAMLHRRGQVLRLDDTGSDSNHAQMPEAITPRIKNRGTVRRRCRSRPDTRGTCRLHGHRFRTGLTV